MSQMRATAVQAFKLFVYSVIRLPATADSSAKTLQVLDIFPAGQVLDKETGIRRVHALWVTSNRLDCNSSKVHEAYTRQFSDMPTAAQNDDVAADVANQDSHTEDSLTKVCQFCMLAVYICGTLTTTTARVS
eukprot:10704-Heterococcus_DN1.PRE.2